MRVARAAVSGRVGAGGTGAAVWLQPVGAHLITSCRNVDEDLSGPRPRSTGGQRLAHAGVSGETRAVVTWRGHAKGLGGGQPAAIDEGVLGWELGRSG